VSRVPGNLTEHKLLSRAKSMLDAGHADDADLDIEAANAISTLERELEEARALVIEANNSLYGSQGYYAQIRQTGDRFKDWKWLEAVTK